MNHYSRPHPVFQVEWPWHLSSGHEQGKKAHLENGYQQRRTVKTGVSPRNDVGVHLLMRTVSLRWTQKQHKKKLLVSLWTPAASCSRLPSYAVAG